MGASLSRTWFIYGRDKQDKWFEDPIDSTLTKDDDCRYHMGRFKHKVFLFALQQGHQNCSKIYLYQGWRRVKADLTDDALIITFSDTEARDAWDTCRRSKKGNEFDLCFNTPDKYYYTYTFTKMPSA